MPEIPEPYLTEEEIRQALRTWCHCTEAMINQVDWDLMDLKTRINPIEAKKMVLISWSYLRIEDRQFIFPCSCCIFVPHIHDSITGCGFNIVYLDEWPEGEGHPRPMQEGVSYEFDTLFI